MVQIGSTHNRAGNRCNRVAEHGFVDVDRVAVLIEHIGFCSGAVESADGVKHINKAEGDNQHDGAENSADVAARKSGRPGLAVEYACDADRAAKSLKDWPMLLISNTGTWPMKM